MKKVAVFGGTGYVGERLVQKLIEQNYIVRLLVRDTKKLKMLERKPGIETVFGRIEDPLAVLNTLEGCDACMVVTGPRSKGLIDMHSIVSGTRHVLAGMAEKGVTRLIKLSGTSVRVPGEPFPLPRRALDFALNIAMKNPSKSKYLEHEDILASDVEWTIVRPPVIADKSFSKQFSAHDYRHLGFQVGLNDLCAFMIEQIDSKQWIRKCPVVGYR